MNTLSKFKKFKLFLTIFSFLFNVLFSGGAFHLQVALAQTGLRLAIYSPQNNEIASAVEYTIMGETPPQNGKVSLACNSGTYEKALQSEELTLAGHKVKFDTIPGLANVSTLYNCTLSVSVNDGAAADQRTGITVDQQAPTISEFIVRDEQGNLNPTTIYTNKVDLLFTFTDNAADSTKIYYGYKVNDEWKINPNEPPRQTVSSLPIEKVVGRDYYVIKDVSFPDVSGSYTFSVILVDIADNESSPQSRSVSLNTNPTGTITFPTSPSANRFEIEFSEDLKSATIEAFYNSTILGSLELTGEDLKAAKKSISLSRISGLQSGQSLRLRATLKDLNNNTGTIAPTGERIADLVTPTAQENIIKIKNTYDTTLPQTLGASVTTNNKIDLLFEKGALKDDVTSKEKDLKISLSNDGAKFGSQTDPQGVVSGDPISLSSLLTETISNKEYYKISGWHLPNTLGNYYIWARVYDEAGNAINFRNGPIRYETRISEYFTYDFTSGESLASTEPLSDVKIISGKIKSGYESKLVALRYPVNPGGNETLPAELTPLAKYIDLSFIPAEGVEWPITLRVYFTENELKGVGADASKIVGIGYFGDDNKWHLYSGAGESSKVVTPSDKPGFIGYVEATITHLTPITILIDITPPTAPTTVHLSIEDTTAEISWEPIEEAVKYYLTLKLVEDGTVATIETSQTKVRITDLTPGKSYILEIKAEDKYGNISTAFTLPQFTIPLPPSPAPTPTAPTPTPTPPAKKPVVKAGVPVAVAAELPPTPTPEVTPTPTPTPSPEISPSPEVSPSPVTEETKAKDRTPWIVLGILIVLAAAATAGYFYFFKEEEALIPPEKPEEKKKEKKKEDEEKPRW